MSIIIKTVEQIDGIKKSCILAANTLNYIEPFVQPGISTGDLNAKTEEFIRDHGAIPAPLNYPGPHGHLFPAATCISINEVICHGIPDDRVLHEGDITNIDVTTILDGYYGDTSRTFAVGKISPRSRHLIWVAKQCLRVGIAVVREGERFGRIGQVITKEAKAEGYSVVHQFCGHGVGLQFHEEPQICHAITENLGPKMMAGMIFTIEPMINEGVAEATVDENDNWTVRTVDGKLSAQFEHTVLVTKNGFEILTLGD